MLTRSCLLHAEPASRASQNEIEQHYAARALHCYPAKEERNAPHTLHRRVRQSGSGLHSLSSLSLLQPQGGYIIFNATMSASLGMTLNTTSPNTYNLDLFNAERHTTGMGRVGLKFGSGLGLGSGSGPGLPEPFEIAAAPAAARWIQAHNLPTCRQLAPMPRPPIAARCLWPPCRKDISQMIFRKSPCC